MPKGNCDHYLETFVPTIGKIQFRYNIRKVVREDMDESSHESYDYDYVNLDEVTREELEKLLENEKNKNELVESALRKWKKKN
jgi:predicted phosphoribosyltransferase